MGFERTVSFRWSTLQASKTSLLYCIRPSHHYALPSRSRLSFSSNVSKHNFQRAEVRPVIVYRIRTSCGASSPGFTLHEINQMEREMCSYLEWELSIDESILKNSETTVTRYPLSRLLPYVWCRPQLPTQFQHKSHPLRTTPSLPPKPPKPPPQGLGRVL
jgi:hypothetical protein